MRRRMTLVAVGGIALCVAMFLGGPATGQAEEDESAQCVSCHEKVNPGIVKQWKESGHAQSETGCAECHGTTHVSEKDVAQAALPTPDTCKECHEDQYGQFAGGKHAVAWIAMNAMPTTGFQPHPYVEGLKGCGGCHKIGLRGEESRKMYRYGMACDSCHTRHKFSAAEARRPISCLPCHMGFDHAQWEMWSTSKHGTVYQTEGDTGRAPTCQTCHMEDGNHSVITAWGFLGVRLPEEDEEWMGYRATILKGLGVLDPEGNPTPRLDVVKAGNVARLTKEDWERERNRMIKVCNRCHSINFVRANLENSDQMLKEADKILAEAIEIVAGLYKDNLIKPLPGSPAYPDLLTFYERSTSIEQKLYHMFMESRMKTFQGAFHNNPDYVTWYGFAAMKKGLVEIRDEAERMRRERQ